MTRAIGYVLLLIASGYVSLELTRRHKIRIEHTEAVCRLVQYIKGNIDLFLTPVDGILSSYTDSTLEECGFGRAMREDGLAAASEGGYLKLSEKSSELFRAFTDSLGTSLREEEVNRCVYYGEQLSALLTEEREKLEKNKTLYRFVPPLCALSVILTVL